MRILHIYKDYYPVLGGIENYSRQLAESMAAKGHEVEVLVTNQTFKTVRETQRGIKVTRAGRLLKVASAPLSFALPLELYRRLYSANPPDIIHLHAPYPVGEIAWLLGSMLPRLGRKRPKVLLTYHSDIVRQKRLLTFYAPFLRKVLKKVDCIIATSPNYVRTSPFLRPVAAKCRVVPLGVDFSRFESSNQAKVGKIRETYGVQDGQVLLFFAGRLRYYKGLQYLIDAMPQVDRAVRLVVGGTGPMKEQLEEQTKRLRLNDRIFFSGEIEEAELADFYAACDIFILPSCQRSEAFGIVQLEAMAAGKPVVSTELGTGTSYVNLDKVTGRVVVPANPTALARAVNELVSEPHEREKAGQRGQERVRTEFSLEILTNRTEKIYIELSSVSKEGSASSLTGL